MVCVNGALFIGGDDLGISNPVDFVDKPILSLTWLWFSLHSLHSIILHLFIRL